MATAKDTDFIIRIPRRLYSKDLQKAFDLLRYKKATKNAHVTQADIDKLVLTVRKQRNEKEQAKQYL